jgi:hypothetical protein
MNRHTILAPLALSLALGACDNMLKETPKSFLTVDNFYRTASDARSAVLAPYETLGGSAMADWRHMMIVDGMGDHGNAHPAEQTPAAYQPGQLAWDAQNIFMIPFWDNSYRVIYRANLAMARIPESPLPDAEKAADLGEMKFMRGWMELEQEKRYGGVPLFTTLEEQANPTPARATREEVDAQIIKDLTDAEAVLPATRPASEWGRATKGAARMALVDLYIWRSSRYATNEWQQAADWARKIIDSGTYRLLDNQLSVFLPNNKGNAEMIFVKTGTGVDARSSTTMQTAFFPRELTPGGGSANVVPTKYALNLFPAGDYRFDVAYRTTGCNTTGTQCFNSGFPQGPHPYKFRPSDVTAGSRGNVDWPIWRYAETVLFYAEALNELGRTDEAIAQVNLIRARARKGTGAETRAVPANLPAGMSKAAVRTAIFKEREYELIFETKRWWDLVRRDTEDPGFLVSELTAHDPIATQIGPIQLYRKLWPIPQKEIISTGGSLTQNPGY